MKTKETIPNNELDIATKIISTRLPMSKYIDVLKKSSIARMTISEWLTMKIYDEENEIVLKKQIEEMKETIEKIEKEKKETTAKADKFRSESEKENNSLKVKISSLEKELLNFKEKVSFEQNNVTKLKETANKSVINEISSRKEINLLQNEVNLLQKKLTAQEEKYKETLLLANKVNKDVMTLIENSYLGIDENKLKNIINQLSK